MTNGDSGGSLGALRLSRLSDEQLLARLQELVGRGRRLTAELVAHLAEVDARRLYLQAACSSLFVYATRRLGMSEGEAYKRITAARLARRLPRVLDLLAEGRIHLSALTVLAPRLTEENASQLLEAACGKTQREVEELLASRSPRPAVPDSVRKLPSRARAEQSSLSEVAEARAKSEVPRTELPAAADRPLVPEAARAAARRDAREEVKPLGEEMYKIAFSATAALRDKLEAARALLSHSLPGAGMGEILERALDALLEKERARRFAVGKRRRRVRGGSSGQPRTGTLSAESSGRGGRVPRYVEADVRRQLVERDGKRCTWTGEHGNRCGETHFLQIDHVVPWCRGGGRELDGLRLLCALCRMRHNRHYAASRIMPPRVLISTEEHGVLAA